MARRGGFPGMGGGNMQSMIQQAQRMQQEMGKVQQAIEEMETEASAGGGVVKVIVSGKKELKSIEIQPEAVDPDDVEMLQDLILSAANEALRNMEELSQKEMSKVTGGMNLGGLF